MDKNNNGGDPTPQPQPNPNPEPNPQPGAGDGDPIDKFKEIKEEYESKLSDKDKEIEDLKKQLAEKDKEVDATVQNLQDEVGDKLAKAEELQKLQKTVEELQKDKAETTVDNLISKGIILPVQRDIAVELALTSPDTFIKLYENAQPIVQVGEQKSKKVPAELAGQLTNYLK